MNNKPPTEHPTGSATPASPGTRSSILKPSTTSREASKIRPELLASSASSSAATSNTDLPPPPEHGLLKKRGTISRIQKKKSILFNDPSGKDSKETEELHARKSVTIASSASTTASERESEHALHPKSSRLSLTSDKSSDHHLDHQSGGRVRTKSIIVMGRTPVAVIKEKQPEKEPDEAPLPTESVTNSSLNSKQKQKTPPTSTTLQVPEEEGSKDKKGGRGLRTFRIWSPNQDRKSIVVKVGDEQGEAEAEKIFESSQMRQKTYTDWHRQAKSRLPSMSGGPAIQNVADVINMAPALQKQEDPRTLEKNLRRMSNDSGDKTPLATLTMPIPTLRRKSSVKVDYTKVREISWKDDKEGDDEDDDSDDDDDSDEDDDSDDDDDDDADENKEKKRDSSSDEFVIDISDEEERRLERERKQAGIDIKNKVKTLKELAEHLTTKRVIRQQLVQKATGLILLDTEQIPLKEHILYLIEDAGDIIHDFIDSLAIWQGPIREINGRFGIVIASYFIWVRQMVALELFAFIVTNAIIIIPQIVEDVNDSAASDIRDHRPFKLSDIINGEGSFHHSYLYYTGYHSRNEDSKHPFKNPAFRFVFCMLFIFFIFTYFIFSRLTHYYQSIRMESKVSALAHMDHFKSIICGWDFSCHDPQAKFYLHKTIKRELYILARSSDAKHGGSAVVHMEMERNKVLAYAVKKLGLYWGPWAIFIFGNIFILLACLVLGTVLVNLCQLKLLYYIDCVSLRDDQTFNKNLHHKILCPDGSQYLNTWILSLPALFASMTTLLLTKFILIIGDREIYTTPERKIYATMIRAGIFNFTNIGVFYTFWISQKPILRKEGFVAETIFGKELYRLVVIQGLMDVVLNFGVKGLYHLIRRKKKDYVMTEFRTEYCSLSMFFIHSVSRIGTLFCPPISIFVTFRLVLDFYQNRFTLLHMSAKESYSAHASQVYAPFLLTFFILCYLITSFMNVYYITETTPSDYNGPFKSYKESYDEVLGQLLEAEKGIAWLRRLATPGFLVTLNAILAALVYFCREWGKAYEPIIDHLNELIALERADRDLLLKAIYEIGKVTNDQVVTRTESKKSILRKGSLIKAVNAVTTDDESSDSDDEEEPAPVKAVKVIEGAQKDERRKSGGLLSNFFEFGRPLPIQGQNQAPAKATDSLGTRPSTTTIDSISVERRVDDQIDALIRDIKTRRTVDFSSLADDHDDPDTHQRRLQQYLHRRASTPNGPPPMVPTDKEKLAQRRKSVKYIEEQQNKNRVNHMNSILENIVEERRKLLRRGTLASTQPHNSSQDSAKSAVSQAQVKPKPKPLTMNQQLQQLSVVKTGAVSTATGTAKRRDSKPSSKGRSLQSFAAKKFR